MYLLNVPLKDTSDSFAKDRTSTKTSASISEEFMYSPSPAVVERTIPCHYRMELFERTVQTMQVSQKVHQRAVSWMITICWSKSLSQECLWTTLLLYYSFKAKKKLSKEDLQLTLLTCLSLALKMSTIKLYSTKQLAALSSRSITPADIVDKEAEILDLVEFNLVIPHQLEQLYSKEDFSQQHIEKIMLLCELLMVKDQTIFFDRNKLCILLKVLGARLSGVFEQSWEQMRKMCEQLKKLMQLKECKIILNKYSSKLDIEHLKTLFL